MKYSIVLKFLAVFLAAVALLGAIVCSMGVLGLEATGLYSGTVEELKARQQERELRFLAEIAANRYAAENYSNCPQDFLGEYLAVSSQWEGWSYTLQDENGKLLSGKLDTSQKGSEFEYLIRSQYPVIRDYRVLEDGIWSDYAAFDASTPTAVTSPVQAEVAGNWLWLEAFQMEDENGRQYLYELAIYQGPLYLVTVRLPNGVWQTEETLYRWLELGYRHRFTLIWCMLGCLGLFALCQVYLCCAAGRGTKTQQVRPSGLNRLPLDLYLALAAGGAVAVAALWVHIWYSPQVEQHLVLYSLLAGIPGLAATLLIVGFFFALAAQTKTGEGIWYRNTLVFRVLALAWRLIKAAWQLVKKLTRTVVSAIGSLFRLLPLTWQWLAVAFGAGALVLFSILVKSPFLLVLSTLGAIAAVVYMSQAFGLLMESAQKMASGDLNTQIKRKGLLGCFREFAGHLNALADVAVVAAKKQMKSERMKAELVTNVSHDIKTPLTSIINYVDLLQKAQSEEEKQQYLQVLERQSLRLKKLIEDLMEMSKASTGNMSVDLTQVDMTESINQALGEFSDKLDAARLIPVFQPPKEPVVVRADGRLTWRVLSNLLSNAVKYALPGTRLYIDMAVLDGHVLVSLKNISREQLNVSSEELLERFVRGDASRNTEGSGLGLNIARSLMELQKGRLQLLVDGDLFKVTLVFPQGE